MRVTLLDGSYLTDEDDTIVAETEAQIIYHLESILEAGGSPSELEVEGRLGVLLENDERIRLPLDSPVLLEEPIPHEFDYKFEGAINEFQFFCLLKDLSRRLGLTTVPLSSETVRDEEGESTMPSVSLVEPIYIQTNDVFVIRPLELKAGATPEERKAFAEKQQQSDRVRITHNARNKITEGIVKEPKVKLNIYSGRDPHEYEVEVLLSEAGQGVGDDTRTSADYRVSINREIQVPIAECAQLIQRQKDKPFCRSRKRCTLPLFGVFRLDCTIVNTSGNSKQSYEIELEINPWVLYHHYLKRKNNDPSSRIRQIIQSERYCPAISELSISDFVSLMHQFVGCLTTSGTRQLIDSTKARRIGQKAVFECDLRECAVPEDVLRTYLERFNPVVPLIGDYGYRLAPFLPKKLTDAEVADCARLELNAEELARLEARNQERLNRYNAAAREN